MEGLLEGCPEGEREARIQLLEKLTERGVPLETLRNAVEEDRLVLLPVELELAGQPQYTPEQVAELAGLPQELLEANWKALGMSLVPSGVVAYTEEDLEAAKRVKMFLDGGLPEEGVLDTARVIGQ